MKPKTKPIGRVISMDAHPDTFTAAVIAGETPAAAIVEKMFNRVPIKQLCGWAKKNTQPEDLIVLEASGNSFEIVRQLAGCQRQAKVLESNQIGRLKESYASNDKISAVRIGKAYLSGSAKEVWVPDAKTQERRDWFLAHGKTVKRLTQARNRLKSYLSDHGVRLPKGTRLAKGKEAAEQQLRKTKEWTQRQWRVIEGYLLELRQADELRNHWRSLIAQEVLADPQLLSLVRLCGVREIVAFALGAIIGDIQRFASPKKLVAYVGLNPAFDDSGNEQWRGGIGGHGRKDLRSLLIEAAQSLFRSSHPLAQWGKKLLARKSSRHLVVAAMARKLTVAIWYLMMGRWMPVEQIEGSLVIKVGKIIGSVGAKALKATGKTRRAYRDEIYQSLKTGRTYVLDRRRTMPATKTPTPVAPQLAERFH